MSIQAVIFDMYETLVTQFCSPLYCGTDGLSGGIVSGLPLDVFHLRRYNTPRIWLLPPGSCATSIRLHIVRS